MKNKIVLVGQSRRNEKVSQIINGEFFKNETWLIMGTAKDYRSQPVDLTDGQVMFRMADPSGNVVIDANTTSGGSFVNAAAGTYQFIVSPAAQAEIAPGHYKYEVKIIMPSGRETVQNTGTIRVIDSLFSN